MTTKRTVRLLIFIAMICLLQACQLSDYSYNRSDNPVEEPPINTQVSVFPTNPSQETQSLSEPKTLNISNELLSPDDFEYVGAFRVPEDENWDYSGQALTFYPLGDPSGENDDFPGSLFISGHDHQLYVAEINIPQPILSKNMADLNTAGYIQNFSDLTPRLFSNDLDLPRIGIEYFDNRLYYVRGQHFQDFEPSHGWTSLDLQHPSPQGPYLFGDYTNYVTSDYIFSIPDSWSAQYLPGYQMATGRFREGVWGGRGPALFAFSTQTDSIQNNRITGIKPLLLYGVQEPGMTDITSSESQEMNGYLEADHWWDGAWLTTPTKSALVFVGTKAIGSSWYGFSNGVVWDYECADTNTCPDVPDWPHDNRGYWAEGYQAQLIFFDPGELGAVTNGKMETWEPQPYATLILDDDFIDPNIHLEEYKTDLTGAMAYDSTHQILYIIERLADEYRSIIHVWKIND